MIDPPPIRACHVCVHSSGENTAADKRCHAREVCGATALQALGVDCQDARAPSGPCGPEARFLEIIERKSNHV